jgi:hypothetical protein
MIKWEIQFLKNHCCHYGPRPSLGAVSWNFFIVSYFFISFEYVELASHFPSHYVHYWYIADREEKGHHHRNLRTRRRMHLCMKDNHIGPKIAGWARTYRGRFLQYIHSNSSSKQNSDVKYDNLSCATFQLTYLAPSSCAGGPTATCRPTTCRPTTCPATTCCFFKKATTCPATTCRPTKLSPVNLSPRQIVAKFYNIGLL